MLQKLNVYQTFLNIHDEVVGKIEYIKKLEVRAQQLNVLIPEKENQVAALRQEVDELKKQNKQHHDALKESKQQKKQYEEKISELLQFIKTLNEKIEKYHPTEDDLNYELPNDLDSKLNLKFNEVMQLLSLECSHIELDVIEEERKSLHEANKELQKEIIKLSKFPKDWRPIDNFNKIVIEECEMRYSPESDAEFQSLSSIPIPTSKNSPDFMENCYMPVPIPPQDVEPLKQDINNFVQAQGKQNDFINSTFKSQAEYLNALRDILSTKSLTEQDLHRFESQVKNQSQQMDELTEISPIKIPEIKISDDEDQSIQILSEKFDQFCQQIESEHPYNSLAEDFINSTEDSLNIPQFEEPPAIPYVKKPIPSSDLVHLADSLKDLINSANKVESLRQIQEKVSLQRQIFEENSTKEDDSISAQTEKDSEIFKLQLPRPLSPPPENLVAIEFKELEKSKLPDVFQSIPDPSDFVLFVDKPSSSQDGSAYSIPQEESNLSNPFSSFKINEPEPAITMNADERAQAFHDILKEFASFEFQPVPHFTPPPPLDLRVNPIDLQPMKDQFEGFLNTSEEDITTLIDEIAQLESEFQKHSTNLKNELSDIDPDSKFTIEDIESAIENLNIKKKMIEKSWTPSINSAKEITRQIKETLDEIEELKKKLNEVTITPEMIQEKNDELSAKQSEILIQIQQQLRKC